MVVGIDNISPGASTGVTAAGGMRTFLQDLVQNLPGECPTLQFKLFTPERDTSFDKLQFPNLRVIACKVPVNRTGRVMYEQFVLPLQIGAERLDVWLGACNTLPLAARCRKVLIVQSLQFFTQPAAYSWPRRRYLQTVVPTSIRHADTIIALSHASKDQIIARFGVPGDRVEVVHHCLPSHLKKLSASPEMDCEVVHRLLGDGPFALAVSALYPYKNHARLIEAFARVRREFPGVKLAIAGANTQDLSIKELQLVAEKFGVPKSVRFLGRVADADLAALYRHADVMVMPSLDETFGLTVLEAMHFGCPVITSNRGSMAEVGSEAALLVDPESVDQIAGGLRTVFRNPELRQRMRDRGRHRAAFFSWDRTIGGIVSALQPAAPVLSSQRVSNLT